MNNEALDNLEDDILADPLHFDMTFWAVDGETCGTAFCMGGLAVKRAGDKLHWMSFFDSGLKDWWQKPKRHANFAGPVFGLGIEERATQILGLEESQAHRLFHVQRWPEQFRKEYRRLEVHLTAHVHAKHEVCILETRTAMAQVAVKRLRHFRATNGAE